MRILVLYGTNEGQTRKIAEFLATKFTSSGDDVTLLDAAAVRDTFDLRDYDAALIAASVHAGRYQASVIHFTRANHDRLDEMPSIFLSVSLAAAGTDPEDLQGIAACAEKFKAETGWSRAEVHQVAGAFRFTEYDFFKRWVMRLIAWQKKVKLEPGKDLELTDWKALGAIVDGFRARITSATRPRRAG
jgi:menaquinone-dependent protoporphyrinogen oxidase